MTAGAAGFLLDTNIVLHLSRQSSPMAPVIESTVNLRDSRFRPVISEVTVAELWAFAMSSKWGDTRRLALTEVIDGLVVLPISMPGVNARWSDLSSHTRAGGRALSDNDLWIAATAEVAQLTLVTTDKDFLPLRSRSSFSAIILDVTSR